MKQSQNWEFDCPNCEYHVLGTRVTHNLDERRAAKGRPPKLRYIVSVLTSTAPSKPSIRSLPTTFPHSIRSRRSLHIIYLTIFIALHSRFPFRQYRARLVKDLSTPSISIFPTSSKPPTTSPTYHNVPLPSIQYHIFYHRKIAVTIRAARYTYVPLFTLLARRIASHTSCASPCADSCAAVRSSLRA